MELEVKTKFTTLFVYPFFLYLLVLCYTNKQRRSEGEVSVQVGDILDHCHIKKISHEHVSNSECLRRYSRLNIKTQMLCEWL